MQILIRNEIFEGVHEILDFLKEAEQELSEEESKAPETTKEERKNKYEDPTFPTVAYHSGSHPDPQSGSFRPRRGLHRPRLCSGLSGKL